MKREDVKERNKRRRRPSESWSKPTDSKKLRQAARNALQNACDLVEDAELLLANKRWARSVFLTQIAAEEIGKHIMLVSALMQASTGTLDWNKFWRRYRDHLVKSRNLWLVESVMVTADPISEVEKLDDNVQLIESLKMLSLYSDIVKGEPVLPSKIVSPKIAKAAVKLAKNRVRHFEKTSKEILDADFWLLSNAELDDFLRRMSKTVSALLKMEVKPV